MAGTSVRMFVLGDDPQSLKTVELGNWTGRAIFGPRIQLGEALKTRDELRQPSVYFLLAQSPDNPALAEVYIGEAEDFASRVKAHEKDKDFWEVFVVFGSKDTNLTKAHIRFRRSPSRRSRTTRTSRQSSNCRRSSSYRSRRLRATTKRST